MFLIVLLILAGVAAGFINTLAGGGSTLVLPILILIGLPSPVANATNRVAILLQNITGTARFHKHGKLDVKPVIHITIAASLGAIVGSFFAVKLNSAVFDKILGVVFIFILIMVIKPKQKRSYAKTLPKWLEFVIFLAVGFYGGFIQVGIGFILLGTLNLIENFSLVRANAVKVFIVMCYTIFAVIVFAISDKIIWLYGLILAIGNIIGAWIGVHAAVKRGDKIVKIVLATAICIACLKLFGVFTLIGL
ncbi:MAG: sulfite exporter TauE/SafE family protein [Candidatus Cloacimonetes bacterium]|nr:sulfite exporter TauE/SafE family protein [Candidatus Cloacimonadota bacterium]MCF7814396.1 sulfite exporter TauE/SafE family protein [Candidatus Cloacimonadota bacterium]MCF7868524.1 sulfite exporter TauE/SafE family protein [Candidatus Cloacimonadota bacterium]MCF7884056.1 sulfite exporter TauE/SafE family protein [Candidatus Cloacimonadota bacterium]